MPGVGPSPHRPVPHGARHGAVLLLLSLCPRVMQALRRQALHLMIRAPGAEPERHLPGLPERELPTAIRALRKLLQALP